jgi:hypothetical protein
MAIKKVDGYTFIEGEFIRNVSVRTGQTLFVDQTLPTTLRNASEFCGRVLCEWVRRNGYTYGLIGIKLKRIQGLRHFELSVLFRPSDSNPPVCAGYFKTTPSVNSEVLHGEFGATLYSDRTPPRLRKNNKVQLNSWECTVDIGHLIG